MRRFAGRSLHAAVRREESSCGGSQGGAFMINLLDVASQGEGSSGDNFREGSSGGRCMVEDWFCPGF